MSGRLIQKKSEDNFEYEVLETPADVKFSDINVISGLDFSDGYSFHHLYIPCSQIKNLGLPTDANPREPTRADVVDKMCKTITENPDKFHHWNNGISVICDDVDEIDEKTVKIYFKEGDGICNGGHTYFSIATFPHIPDNCMVHLELIKLPTGIDIEDRKRVVNQIASTRNRNRQLHPTTQADYLGHYEFFKDWLGNNSVFISWHEGDSEAHQDSIKSDHFIRLLASIDPYWFSHPVIKPKAHRQNHKSATGGIASIHARWLRGVEDGDFENNLYHMAPFGREILQLRDYLSYSLNHDIFTEVTGNLRLTKFYEWFSAQKRTLHFNPHQDLHGLKLPGTFEVLLIGSFRHNVWVGENEDGNPTYIGVLRKLPDLWDSTKCVILDKLKSLFSSFDNDSGNFNRADASFNEQLIDIEYGRNRPDHPEYFYDLSTKNKYIFDEDVFTHQLAISDGRYVELVPTEGEEIPKGAFPYRKE
jgi:hypothetical protein